MVGEAAMGLNVSTKDCKHRLEFNTSLQKPISTQIWICAGCQCLNVSVKAHGEGSDWHLCRKKVEEISVECPRVQGKP